MPDSGRQTQTRDKTPTPPRKCNIARPDQTIVTRHHHPPIAAHTRRSPYGSSGISEPAGFVSRASGGVEGCDFSQANQTSSLPSSNIKAWPPCSTHARLWPGPTPQPRLSWCTRRARGFVISCLFAGFGGLFGGRVFWGAIYSEVGSEG